ncbi:MAG: lipid-A-disaccharide synthase [bacterium]|nr:lipid-A-disaccharide synthase [Candidatus Kapabacteria bacterium]
MSIASAPTVMIVAGEASGDMHGAALVKAMKQRVEGLQVIGIGGKHLAAQGLRSIVDASRMNVSGFAEVVRHYHFLRRALVRTIALAHEVRPSIAILVDYPGFNLQLARELHAMGIPVVYYIAPQVWAWKEKRVEVIRRYVDTLIVAFPFEVDYFAQHAITAYFLGHPLVDVVTPIEHESARTHDANRPTIAYLPGSRLHEIRMHMPLMIAVMQAMGERFHHVVPLAATVDRTEVERYQVDVAFDIIDDARIALAQADAALVKAGTSTIEAALAGVPFAAYYRTSILTYHIARRAIKVPWIAMVNILAGKQIVHEFIQSEADPLAMTRELRRLCDDAAYRRTVLSELAKVRVALGRPGAASRAADLIIERHLT